MTSAATTSAQAPEAAPVAVDSTAGQALADSSSEASLQRTIARSAEIEAQIETDPGRFRVLTGDRPTGNLHLGHYFGTLANRVVLQRKGVETFLVIADYQVITDRDAVGAIRDRVLSLIADYLSVGLDPEQTTIFTHSSVPALNQLMLPFLSLVTDSELRRNPTVKAEYEATGGRPMSGLLLTYPVHQAADILFCKANLVPVGKDQLPHLEQARVVARRFDERYGRADAASPVFPTPEALLSRATNLLGTDGQKMSKSRGNTIELGMDADDHRQGAQEGGHRLATGTSPTTRPAAPRCPTWSFWPRSPPAGPAGRRRRDRRRRWRRAEEAWSPPRSTSTSPRSRAAPSSWRPTPAYLRMCSRDGNARAKEVAEETLDEVRSAMQMQY